MRFLLSAFFFLLTQWSFGQTNFSLENLPVFSQNEEELPSAWSGGINSAQIQLIDLNFDGQEEWVIWDINSRQLSVFEKEGNQFIHQPEWTYFFPTDISGFLVLADYDADGLKDLFTSTARGIKAYKNTSSDGNISFEVARDFLPLDNGSNIQANNLDTPLIQDLDGDGDLDLVVFNFASGDYLEFYENTSVDRTGNLDIDGFAFPVTHWGNFEFCDCDDISFGQTCSGLELRIDPSENQKIQHAGGHSILYRDLDGDGIPDLLLGRDECEVLYFLPNKGIAAEPLFDEFSNEIPELGELPRFPIFHNPAFIDEQLIISSNSNEAAQVYGVDFANSIFSFEGSLNPLLQNQIVDLGENARPFYQGNQNGGRLFVGVNVTRSGEVLGEIAVFDFQNGIVELSEQDFSIQDLNLTEIQYLEFQDQSGVSRQLLTGIRFEGNIPQQRIFRQENNQWEEINFSGFEPNRGDHLVFFSYQNQDHLLVAAQNGGLDLYVVDFESLSTELLESNFLGFQDNPANRNLNVAVNPGTQPGLYAVDQRGILIYIENFMELTQREEVQVAIQNQNFLTRLGRNTWITLVPDVLGENPDLILGTRAGGLIYLKAEQGTDPPLEGLQLVLYPNPTAGPLKVISNQSGTGKIVNAMGQVILDEITIQAGQEIELQTEVLNPGLYIFQLQTANRRQLSKKFWVR
ncbi:T9SS type A sorting domain-containing protein [Algoriphagus sp.]|uniref:T9SS type A sorting domain-containing protein n=1 Tax=Algoriphagus sp. TaxID=1872435 RepID=UPI002620191A|nr:T9SS type A sorting domain-containing protein [Algoriphagus sp.]